MEYISVSDLSKKIGVHKANLFKIIKKLEISPIKRRGASGKIEAFLSEYDAISVENHLRCTPAVENEKVYLHNPDNVGAVLGWAEFRGLSAASLSGMFEKCDIVEVLNKGAGSLFVMKKSTYFKKSLGALVDVRVRALSKLTEDEKISLGLRKLNLDDPLQTRCDWRF